MELYGSLSNISGSVTASYFTGSYIGDGAGLYNLPASGVTGLNLSQIASGSVTASVNPNGFNVNTSTSITGSLNVSGTVLSQTTPLVSGSSQINITGTTGYSTFSSSIATTDSNQESRLNLIETSTGSLNSFSSSIDTTIKNKLNIDGVISGSSQILNGSNIVSSSAQVTAYGFATTGSNLFIGTQTHSGSILPSVDNAYDLGSATYQWRDVYISSGSLYIDGTKVIGSTAQELTITTDTGQSIKILEGTTDSIILQTADGDIELKSSADGDILLDPTNGKIMLKGPIEILNGQKIQSSVGGTPVVFANDIVVSGSIDITGTIEGINLTDFSSSLNTRLGTLEVSTGSINSFTSSAIGRLNSIESTTSSLNSYTTSANSKFTSIESVTSSFASYSGTTDGRLNAIETSTGSLNTYSSSTNSRLSSIESTTASLTSTNTTQDGRLTSLENKTGSYATTGSNVFQGDQIVTGSLFISQNLIVGGSSSINFISQSTLNIGTNLITVNAQNPGTRFGGLAVIDSGSSPTISGSMLFDSIKDEWIFIHQNQGTVTSSVVLMGPQTYNDIGAELYPTTNRLVKSINSEHLGDSNISDNGTTVTILSNAVVNGTFSATGTTLVSGSSQISHDSTTGYVANRHIDHTSVSISAGNGLSGGGDISTTRTLTLDTTSATFTSGVKSKMSADGVVSGSSQISFNGIIDKPALVSGSSQITYGSLSSIPSGIVSGSSQITFGSISSIPGGLVSGSSQIDLTSTTNYASGILTRLNAVGVFSGSAQVTLSSTTGYGSVLNQAVLTTSSPTFAGVSATTFTGALSGNATTATSTGTLSASGTLTTQAGSGTLIHSSPIVSSEAGLFSTGDNSNSIITFNRHPGNYYSQLGFNSTGGIFYRSFNNTAINTSQAWQTVWTSTSLTNLNQLTNGPGYITGISFANVSSKPTTLSGYGITDALPLAGGTMTGTITITNTDIRSNGTSNWTGDPGTQGKIQYHANRWYIVADSSSDRIVQFRRNATDVSHIDNSGVYQGSISGNAATAGGFTPSQTSGTANRIVVADGNGYIINNYFNASGGGSERNASGMGYFAGHNTSDYYYRSYTAAAAAALLSGQAMNISGNATTASSTGTLSSNAVTNGYLVIGGNYSTNAYNGVASTRLMFGGGDSDAVSNYYIGTNMENVGGNYTKLDLRWHTGIRMGAQPGYGGIRFFDTEDLGTVLFSIGNTDGNVRSHTNLIPSANNSYNLGSSSLRWANLYTNDLHLSNEGKEGGNEIDGTTGNWTIQEGEENLYIINNKNGKKFKIDLTEIV